MRKDTMEALEKFQVRTFGNKKNIERVEGMLWDTEKVLFITPTNAVIHSVNTGKKEKLPGVAAVTNQRVIFSYKAAFTESTEMISLPEIRSVESTGNGLTGGTIRIHAMAKTLEILVTYKKETMQAIQNLIYKAIDDCRNAGNSSSGQRENNLEQIEKLHDFLKQGIITEEEFQAKKKQLLGL